MRTRESGLKVLKSQVSACFPPSPSYIPVTEFHEIPQCLHSKCSVLLKLVPEIYYGFSIVYKQRDYLLISVEEGHPSKTLRFIFTSQRLLGV